MKSIRIFPLMIGAGLGLLASSCSKNITANPNQTVVKEAIFVNPYQPGTYAHFKADNYPYTTNTWKNPAVLAKTNASNSRIKIDLSQQRGFLMLGDQIAMDYRVSSGSSNYATPAGQYRIIEKIQKKRSNLYGKVVDSSGKTVKSNADSRKHSVPAGGSFVGASMPYWMRLTGSGIGMHQGNVNRRFASHGCIRTHYSAVPIVFSKTRIGTKVHVTP
ncbi:L,D-transpeptidase [Akkermansiaceae bacterium]|nr:L,D-transpeptidase [Akkermansiaceae bacterium]MDB4537576.1 L,D-transpeptidase [Akkermansiaceae bacterium]